MHSAHAPLTPETLWAAWALDPWILGAVAVSASVYALGVRRARFGVDGRRGLPGWRPWLFGSGIVMLLVALVSPLAPLGASLFSAHMTQHTILMQVAAPLLVLGTPVVALLWSVPRGWRRSLNRLRLRPGCRGLARGVAHPATAWSLHAAALWLWHLPGPYQSTLESGVAHGAQHASFFFTALLFWWVLVRAGRLGRARIGAGLLYVFTTALHAGALGALLTFSWSPWYPAYAGTTAAWGLTPLEDQRLGGAIMWIPGGVPYLIAVLTLLAILLRRADGARAEPGGLRAFPRNRTRSAPASPTDSHGLVAEKRASYRSLPFG